LPLAESPTARRVLLWGALDDAGRLTADEARKMLSASSGAHDLRGAARAALTADLTPDLARIDVPVGLLWGARDPLIPKPVAEGIAAFRPGAPREAIPGAGHVAQIERPLPFALAVENLLDRLPAPVTVSCQGAPIGALISLQAAPKLMDAPMLTAKGAI